MDTRIKYLEAAVTAMGDGKVDVATLYATLAVAVGQGDFIAAVEAMKTQGPPEVGGTRMMTCGNTIGDNACKGKISEHIYVVKHQSDGNSRFEYKCLSCIGGQRVSVVATASLAEKLRPAPAAAPATAS